MLHCGRSVLGGWLANYITKYLKIEGGHRVHQEMLTRFECASNVTVITMDNANLSCWKHRINNFRDDVVLISHLFNDARIAILSCLS